MIQEVRRIFLIAVLLSVSACSSLGDENRDTPEPEFTNFIAGPSPVCLNVGVPIVRLSYEYDADGWPTNTGGTLCVQIRANDRAAHPTLRHSCIDQGTSGVLTMNVSDLFGANAPQTINFTGELVTSIAGTVKDTAETSIATRVDCQQPGTIGQ